MSRIGDVQRFYDALDRLAAQQGGMKPLPDVMAAPMAKRGIYFFFEPDEVRRDSGGGLRVVRIGTHALKAGATSTLRGRLRQHGGSRAGSGNHRGSIFRLLTGDALIRSGGSPSCSSWGSNDATARLGISPADLKEIELQTERAVSHRLASMSVVWLGVDDEPGPASLRGWVERNSIALLSNKGKVPYDPPSAEWLGHHSSRPHVRASGLWNQNHVDENYDPAFLADLEQLIS